MGISVVLAALALTVGSSSDERRDLASEDPFTYGNPAFCAPKEPVEDFGLSQLPAVPEPPEGGDLTFGPKTVRLLDDWGRVIPVGQSFGYELHSENYSVARR